MSNYLHCGQCHIMTNKLYDDPRPNPIDEGGCLCADCRNYALDDINDEDETPPDT